jgi:hypothetical protein
MTEGPFLLCVSLEGMYLCIYLAVFNDPVKSSYYTVVPERKVNILGGHSICHSNQTTVYVHVSYSERFPR